MHTSILPQHRKFLRFLLWGKSISIQSWPGTVTTHLHERNGCISCSIETSRHSHPQLHRRLDHSGSVRGVGGSTSRCCSESSEVLGIKTQCQEEFINSSTENYFPWGSMGFSHSVGTVVSCSYKHHLHHSNEYQAKPGHHCQTLSKGSGSPGSNIPHDSFWPAAYEGPAVVAQDQRVFPEGESIFTSKVTRRSIHSLVVWNKPWFLSQGPVLGASCQRKKMTTDASSWGAVMEGRNTRGLLKDYHLSWHINCLEMLAVILPLRGLHVLVRTDNMLLVSYINR